jgi:hypothetical protein
VQFRGSQGGQALSPPFYSVFLISYSNKMNSPEQKFLKTISPVMHVSDKEAGDFIASG